MLSYQHAYHAGNFADVLKHIVLLEILGHLQRKEKAFSYIDTHAGRGLYDFHSPEALKLREFDSGFNRLNQAIFPEITEYFNVVRKFNSATAPFPHLYPGSPLIAQAWLRKQDTAWLYELHPMESSLLSANVAGDNRIKVLQKDGLEGVLARLPPPSRRACVLIDPSYEVKAEYVRVIDRLSEAYRKFATGIYVVWYPVILRARITDMEQRLIKSNIRNIQRFELGVAPDGLTRGMTSAGLFVVNPPWGMREKMSQLLPRLASTLAKPGSQHSLLFKSDILVAE